MTIFIRLFDLTDTPDEITIRKRRLEHLLLSLPVFLFVGTWLFFYISPSLPSLQYFVDRPWETGLAIIFILLIGSIGIQYTKVSLAGETIKFVISRQIVLRNDRVILTFADLKSLELSADYDLTCFDMYVLTMSGRKIDLFRGATHGSADDLRSLAKLICNRLSVSFSDHTLEQAAR